MTTSAAGEATPRRRTRRKPWLLVALTVLGGFALQGLFHAGRKHLSSPVFWGLAALAVAGAVVGFVARRRARAVGAKVRYGRDDAGHPYDLKVVPRIGVTAVERSLVVTDLALEFDAPSKPGLSAVFGDEGCPGEVPLAAISKIVAGPKIVVVEHGDAGVTTSLRLEPSTDDRDRLLWELALRAPDAVERGMASHTPRAAGEAETVIAAETSRALSGLDGHTAGFASALVAPASRAPAPPRSGLGCGLFVAEPRDDDGGPARS